MPAQSRHSEGTTNVPKWMTIGRLTLKPGMRALAEGVADQGVAMVRSMPGNVSVTFFIDEAQNTYGAASVWESRELADAADATLTPGFTQAFGDALQGAIAVEFFEVYEPNSR